MANFVGNHVSLREFSRSSEAAFQFVKEA